MVKIGELTLGKIPRVALVLSCQKDLNFVKKAKARGIDILEVRIDRLKNINKEPVLKFIKAVKKTGLPVIATVRSRAEGALKNIADNKRLELLEAVLPLVNAVDIELSSKTILKKIVKKARTFKKKVIISYHNFKKTPTDKDLGSLINKAKKAGADIVKIAVQPKNKKDVIRLMNWTLKHKNKNLITIAMGTQGTISRVLFPFAGSVLTYACKYRAVAPGQIPLDVLNQQLKLFYPGIRFSK